VSINSSAASLAYDLAVDASGKGAPSPVAAGLVAPSIALDTDGKGFDYYRAGFIVLGLAGATAAGSVAIRRNKVGA
jgi:hypothetical protein